MPKEVFYSTVPAVPAKKIAGLNPLNTRRNAVGEEGITIDQRPGITRGLAPIHKVHKASHGFGHSLKHKKGHLRLSGHVGAHMVGKRFHP
jgi:hypothetical protein